MKTFFSIVAALIVMAASSLQAQDLVVGNDGIRSGGGGSVLIVLLHGYTLDGDSLDKVEATLRRIKGLESADVLRPNLPLGTFSMAASSRITAELLVAIDKAWAARAGRGDPYSRVVLVGHSAGGLYARKIYAAACGETEEAPFEQALKDDLRALQAAPVTGERPWARAVDRVVLLAGMNRGWSISHHMSIMRALVSQVGVAIGHVLQWIHGRPPIIFTIRRGSPFITQLRLQWLAMRARTTALPEKAGGAATVQLLGTIDDLVSPDDNVDLIFGRDFVYLEVPESGHRNVIDMDESDAGRKRQVALREALEVSVDKREDPSPVASRLVVRSDVTDVVFVIHGIRDEGYWTRKIAYRAQRAGLERGRVITAETSSYGYFPMLSFLRPGSRQEKVEWLMDRYTEARASYPNARFHYVGHSNGTYLLAKALEDYQAVRFDRVVFAGSVVHRRYKWQEIIPHRVKSVVNFVATADWVVAWFPNALQILGVQDLGSAGHDGFELAQNGDAVVQLPKKYVIGGHGAALQEAMWDSIAEFVVTGKFEPPPAALLSTEQSRWVSWPGKVAPLIWIIIAALLALGMYGLLRLRVREWKKTVLIVIYCAAIWTVLTEV